MNNIHLNSQIYINTNMAIVFINSAQSMYVNAYKNKIKQNILHNIKLQHTCKTKNQELLVKQHEITINRLTKELDYWYTLEQRSKKSP